MDDQRTINIDKPGQRHSRLHDIGEKIRHSETGRAVQEEGGEIARDIGGSIKHYVEDIARNGKQTVAERLHHMSDALHKAADTLEEDNEEVTGRYADQAARQLDRACEYLESHDAGDLIQEIDRFARRQPLIFVGSAVLAGVLLGRFLRSSQQSDGQSNVTPSLRKQYGPVMPHGIDEDDDTFGQSGRITPVGTSSLGSSSLGASSSGGIGQSSFRPGMGGSSSGGQSEGQPGGQRSGQSGGQSGPGRTDPVTPRPLTEPPRSGGNIGGPRSPEGGD